MACKVLDLTVGERNEAIALEEVKDALAKKIHYDANVAAIVEAISEMNTSIPVLIVVGL